MGSGCHLCGSESGSSGNCVLGRQNKDMLVPFGKCKTTQRGQRRSRCFLTKGARVQTGRDRSLRPHLSLGCNHNCHLGLQSLKKTSVKFLRGSGARVRTYH